MTLAHIRPNLATPLLIGLAILGMSPFFSFWPLGGLWAAAAWGSLAGEAEQPSVSACLCLCLLGLVQDLIHEAPLGIWPLSFLAAYLTAMSFAGRGQMFPGRIGSFIGYSLAMAAAVIVLGLCAAPWEDVTLDLRRLGGDLLATALLYPFVRTSLTGTLPKASL